MALRGPIASFAITFFRDYDSYDLDGLKKLAASLGECSIEDKMKILRENLESYKKPTALLDNGNKEDEEDDVDDYDDDGEEGEEYLELIRDEMKPASGEQILLIGDEIEPTSGERVTDAGERLYKKPRLAEDFEFPREAEAA